MRWIKYCVTTQNVVIELCEENSLARQLRDFSMSPKAPALLIQHLPEQHRVSNGSEDGGNRSKQWALRYGINYQQNKQIKLNSE